MHIKRNLLKSFSFILGVLVCVGWISSLAAAAGTVSDMAEEKDETAHLMTVVSNFEFQPTLLDEPTVEQIAANSAVGLSATTLEEGWAFIPEGEGVDETSEVENHAAHNLPFECKPLGAMKIVAHNQRSNGERTRNRNGMTVTINPNLVPYGSIVYIEGLGFRYNQAGTYSDDTSNVYVYFSDSEEVETWNEKEANIYLVNNNANMDLANSDLVETVSKGDFKLTAYCPCSICCGCYGAAPQNKFGSIGTYVYEGTTIAVDPSVIPYGSLVYIEGIGLRFAADCGGAIKTNRIDMYFASHEDAEEFGVQNHNIMLVKY